ncbi:MAG TPA: hypothetical protein VGR26_04525 [Acidimicrobiales bacterium]|nr:hypothetical protein [Acidimicrobiales bacterium]
MAMSPIACPASNSSQNRSLVVLLVKREAQVLAEAWRIECSGEEFASLLSARHRAAAGQRALALVGTNLSPALVPEHLGT